MTAGSKDHAVFLTYAEAIQPVQCEEIEVFARFMLLTMSGPGEKESCVT